MKRHATGAPSVSWLGRFGIRGVDQLKRDVAYVLGEIPRGERFTFDLGSSGLLRPDLSLPAYAGFYPDDGIAPIFNFYDRGQGGHDFRYTVKRSRTLRDWRGGRLSYDEHDGTDFVCPPGTPLVAAAPGRVVAARDTWTRGGLTLCVDHGDGVVTQYTHLQSITAAMGQWVARGEQIAWSGVSGLDMTQFFPWVPPHVHFMVWVDGKPVDPYRAEGEARDVGAWLDGNDPQTSDARADDVSPESLKMRVDERALDQVIAECRDARIAGELAATELIVGRLAIVEDSLHHDRRAWPAEAYGAGLRLPGDPRRVRLTLPLSRELYRGARPADTRFTRP